MAPRDTLAHDGPPRPGLPIEPEGALEEPERASCQLTGMMKILRMPMGLASLFADLYR